jgi:hypothetical protein
MVFNATFNDISVISWWSVLSVEKTEYPEKNNRLAAITSNLYHILLYRVHLPIAYGTDSKGINGAGTVYHSGAPER